MFVPQWAEYEHRTQRAYVETLARSLRRFVKLLIEEFTASL